MMDSKLLQEAIADAKAVRHLGLAWREGQFVGSMKYVSYTSNDVERASCHCSYCNLQIPLETSSSHAKVCTQPQSSSFNAVFAAKLKEEWCDWENVPSFCEMIEKEIDKGNFGDVKTYRV